MTDARTNSMDLTPAEIDRALAALRCLPCGRPKAAGSSFCATCWSALPVMMRVLLGRDPRDNFRAAACHLELNPVRAKIFKGPAGSLPYRSTREFEAAGYKLSGYGKCAVPRCDADIAFFWTPDKERRICVNRGDLQPHKASCADPGYFARKRAVKTSAKRKGA